MVGLLLICLWLPGCQEEPSLLMKIHEWNLVNRARSMEANPVRLRLNAVMMMQSLRNSGQLNGVLELDDRRRLTAELNKWIRSMSTTGYRVQDDPLLQSDDYALSLLGYLKEDAILELLRRQNADYCWSLTSKTGEMDPTFLSLELVADVISLNRSQRAEAKTQLQSYRAEVAQLENGLRLQRSEIFQQKWDRLMGLLNARQREDYQELIGKPFDWSLAERKPDFVKANFVLQGDVLVGDQMFTLLGEDQWEHRSQIQLNRIQEDERVVYVPANQYRCIMDPTIANNLKLTQKQEYELRLGLETELKSFGWVVDFHDKQRLEQLLEGTAEVASCIGRHLNEEQIERLLQMELQILLRNSERSCFLLSPQMETKWNLTDQQLQQIRSIIVESDEKERQSEADFVQSRRESEVDYREAVIGKLGTEQREFYFQLFPAR